MNLEQIKVVFIAGYGRSGSTVLSNIIETSDNVLHLGEFSKYLFDLDMQRRKVPCSCGEVPNECEFWREVFSELDRGMLARISNKIRVRNIWRKKLGLTAVEVEYVRNVFDRVLALVKEKYPKIKYVVDSSKHPSALYLWKLVGYRDLKVVHFIRGCLSSVDSWSKPKGYLRKKSFFKAGLDWVVINELAESAINKTGYPAVRVSYSTFVSDPRGSIDNIAEQLELDGVFVPGDGNVFHRERAVHSLAGNPEKFKQVGAFSVFSGTVRTSKYYDFWLKFMLYPWIRKYE